MAKEKQLDVVNLQLENGVEITISHRMVENNPRAVVVTSSLGTELCLDGARNIETARDFLNLLSGLMVKPKPKS